MKVEFLEDKEKEFGNLELNSATGDETALKKILVDYVGNKINPENEEVTVEMVIEVLANEFPEFVMAVAEENWIRGYQQALTDISIGEKLQRQELEKDA